MAKLAAKNGRLWIVKYLLNKEVNTSDVLICAAEGGYKEIVDYTIERIAHSAAKHGRRDIVKAIGPY